MSVRRAALHLGLGLWRAGVGAAASAEGDPERFTFQQLDFAERTWERRLADIDADGDPDLLMIVGTGGQPPRFALRVCTLGDDGRFASDCPSTELPRATRAFEVCRVGGRPHLLLLTDDAARWAPFTKDGGLAAFAPLPGVRSFVDGTDVGRLLAQRACFDLDDDGTDEILVPTPAGPALHRIDDTGAAASEALALEAPPRIRYRRGAGGLDLDGFLRPGRYAPSTYTQTIHPDLFVLDFDGDGRRDVVTRLGNELRLFAQDGDGTIPSRPTRIVSRARDASLEEEELDQRDGGEATSFTDLDGDGRQDLVVLRWGEEERTRMDRFVYKARADGSFPEEPDQSFRSESVFPFFTAIDLTGDGRQELVLPYFHVAPAQAIRMITENALKLQLRIHVMREDGRYAQDPGREFAKVDRRLVLDYHLDVPDLISGVSTRRAAGARAPFFAFDTDIDGDGFRDILADDGDDRLRVYLGDAEAGYGSGPDFEIPLESTFAFDVLDANGDGKSDIVTWYGARHVREENENRFAGSKVSRERERREERAREAARAAAPAGPPPETRVKILLSR